MATWTSLLEYYWREQFEVIWKLLVHCGVTGPVARMQLALTILRYLDPAGALRRHGPCCRITTGADTFELFGR